MLWLVQRCAASCGLLVQAYQLPTALVSRAQVQSPGGVRLKTAAALTDGGDLQKILKELWQQDTRGQDDLLQKVQDGSLPASMNADWNRKHLFLYRKQRKRPSNRTTLYRIADPWQHYVCYTTAWYDYDDPFRRRFKFIFSAAMACQSSRSTSTCHP